MRAIRRLSLQGSNPLPLLQKLISGRYLGEILRLIICELIDDGVLFLGQNTYKVEIPYSFDTAFLSLMERHVVFSSSSSAVSSSISPMQ